MEMESAKATLQSISSNLEKARGLKHKNKEIRNERSVIIIDKVFEESSFQEVEDAIQILNEIITKLETSDPASEKGIMDIMIEDEDYMNATRLMMKEILSPEQHEWTEGCVYSQYIDEIVMRFGFERLQEVYIIDKLSKRCREILSETEKSDPPQSTECGKKDSSFKIVVYVGGVTYTELADHAKRRSSEIVLATEIHTPYRFIRQMMPFIGDKRSGGRTKIEQLKHIQIREVRM